MSIKLGRVGRYELSTFLSNEKTHEVWLASDPLSHRSVIIKVFRTTLRPDSDAMLQFRQYIQQVASFQHPNVVHIHDMFVLPSKDLDDSSTSMVCIVTDHIEGSTLADYLQHPPKGGRIRPGVEMVHFFTLLGMAIDAAHQDGIIHGNLRPGSIVLKREESASEQPGEPLLTDFGFTKLLKNTGGMLSPFYLSPEQIRGFPATERSDTYSLGVILYELCTGVLPFRGSRPIAIMMQHLNALPTPPEVMNPTISSALTGVILRSLMKEPENRFPSASTLTIALAHALNVPVPQSLSQIAYVPEEVQPGNGLQPLLQTDAKVSLESKTFQKNGVSTRAYSAGNGTDIPLQIAMKPRPRKPRSRSSWYIGSILALLLVSLGTFASILLLQRNSTATPNQIVGHAFFLSSGQFNADNPQGSNDELQMNLSGIPNPPAGKRYYAWLLADQNNSESLPLLLGPLQIKQGNVRFLYPGNQQHTNLLGKASRFLITLDDAQHPTNNPLIDIGSWRYYAVIPFVPSPVDTLHFSMLDHLRHLLYESPELSIRGLHGGLAFWLVRNSATLSALADNSRDAWHNKDTAETRAQIIRLLDYLDGGTFVGADVPPGTPMLADTRTSQVALLGPDPQNPDAPGYAYKGEIPPGYVYLISEHMSGAIQAPQTTPDQRKLAVQINKELDGIKNDLKKVEQDAKQLLNMDTAQFLQPSTLTLLNDLATLTQTAYTGQIDPATGQSSGGALQIYGNLQHLAAFDVRVFVPPTTK